MIEEMHLKEIVTDRFRSPSGNDGDRICGRTHNGTDGSEGDSPDQRRNTWEGCFIEIEVINVATAPLSIIGGRAFISSHHNVRPGRSAHLEASSAHTGSIVELGVRCEGIYVPIITITACTYGFHCIRGRSTSLQWRYVGAGWKSIQRTGISRSQAWSAIIIVS